MTKAPLWFALAWLGAVGCGGGGTACTLEAVFGLNVTVLDAATGARICDAMVKATDGSYSETLMPLSGVACVYVGATERAGKYELTASASGFMTATQRDVNVTSGVCHVSPAAVTLRLSR